MQEASQIFPTLFHWNGRKALKQEKRSITATEDSVATETYVANWGWGISIRQVQIFSLTAMHEKSRVTGKQWVIKGPCTVLIWWTLSSTFFGNTDACTSTLGGSVGLACSLGMQPWEHPAPECMWCSRRGPHSQETEHKMHGRSKNQTKTWF